MKSPLFERLCYSFRLDFPCTNNVAVAEYEALVNGLELALVVGIKYIRVFSDSELVVNQTNGV